MSENCKVIFPATPKDEREDVFEDSNGENEATELLATFNTLYEISSDMYDVDDESFVQFGFISGRPHIVLFVKSHDGIRHGIAIDRELLLSAIVSGFSDMKELIPEVEEVMSSLGKIDGDEDDSDESDFMDHTAKNIPEAC